MLMRPEEARSSTAASFKERLPTEIVEDRTPVQWSHSVL